jgi:S1-C subfamily serine protease
MHSRKDLHKLAAALGGLPVLGCIPNSSANRAGVVSGDILLSVNGRPTPDWMAFVEARSLNDEAMVCEVFRDGVTREVVVPLHGSARLDPAQLLAELIAERLLPLDQTPPTEPN